MTAKDAAELLDLAIEKAPRMRAVGISQATVGPLSFSVGAAPEATATPVVVVDEPDPTESFDSWRAWNAKRPKQTSTGNGDGS